MAPTHARLPAGVLTGAVALAFVVTLLAVGDWSRPGDLALEIVLCLAAGASGRWLVGGGVGVGLALGILPAMTVDQVRLSMLTVPLVLLVASSRGRWLLVGIFAAWYLPLMGLIESGGTDPRRYLSGLSVCAFALALSVLIGWQTHRFRSAHDRLTRENAAALQAQRRSIARDLHDTVAQATTAIVLRAEAGKLRAGTDPDLTDDLAYIASVGRHCLRDLRGMLVAMRDDQDAAEPRIALRSETPNQALDKQVRLLRAAAFDVRVLVQAPIDTLPESIRYTLNCAITEAATNILRHGRPGSDCAIMICQSGGDLEVVIRNEAGGRSSVPTSRFGLIGLAERVHALDGEIETFAHDRNWVLRVRIPLVETRGTA